MPAVRRPARYRRGLGRLPIGTRASLSDSARGLSARLRVVAEPAGGRSGAYRDRRCERRGGSGCGTGTSAPGQGTAGTGLPAAGLSDAGRPHRRRSRTHPDVGCVQQPVRLGELPGFGRSGGRGAGASHRSVGPAPGWIGVARTICSSTRTARTRNGYRRRVSRVLCTSSTEPSTASIRWPRARGSRADSSTNSAPPWKMRSPWNARRVAAGSRQRPYGFRAPFTNGA